MYISLFICLFLKFIFIGTAYVPLVFWKNAQAKETWFYSGLSPLLFNLKEVKLVLKFFPYRMKGLNLCPLHVKQIILFWDSFFHLSVSKTDRGNYLHGVSFGWGERINDKNNKPYSILESSPS